MANDPDNSPAPAPAPGLLERLALKMGAKSESEIVQGLKVDITNLETENAVLISAANDAQVTINSLTAELAAEKHATAVANGKLVALNAIVPGISGAPDPAAALTAAITKASTDQIASMGLPPESAPGIETKAPEAKVLTRSEFDKLDASAQGEHFRNGGKLKED